MKQDQTNFKTDARKFIITSCADCAAHHLEPDTNPLYFRIRCEGTDTYSATGLLPYDIIGTPIPEWCPKLKGEKKGNGNNKKTARDVSTKDLQIYNSSYGTHDDKSPDSF